MGLFCKIFARLSPLDENLLYNAHLNIRTMDIGLGCEARWRLKGRQSLVA